MMMMMMMTAMRTEVMLLTALVVDNRGAMLGGEAEEDFNPGRVLKVHNRLLLAMHGLDSLAREFMEQVREELSQRRLRLEHHVSRGKR